MSESEEDLHEEIRELRDKIEELEVKVEEKDDLLDKIKEEIDGWGYSREGVLHLIFENLDELLEEIV
jgi:cell division septum initiation protein DivIVA